MSSTRLAATIVASILISALILFVAWQAMKPQDCALQRLEVQSGDRLEGDLSGGCR